MSGPLKVTDDKSLPDTMKTNPTPHDSRNIDAILGVGDGKKDLCVTTGTNGSAQEGYTVWKEKAKLIILQHFAHATQDQKVPCWISLSLTWPVPRSLIKCVLV